MTRIGFPIPRKENERRRALLPSHVRLVTTPSSLVFEQGYGHVLGFDDASYVSAGAVVADRDTVCKCPVICNPKPMLDDEYFQPGKVLLGWLHAVQGRRMTDLLTREKMTAIAWEDMFKEGRHVFWRNNEIAGEAAVSHAFLLWGRVPYAVKVALIGRGNVARGAFRVLEREGCAVSVYDRKTAHRLRMEIDRYEVIVNAVLWDVLRKDHLVYEEDLAKMRPGSLIIDISCDERMGIESSRPTTIEDPVYLHKGVLHYVVDHAPAIYYKSSSHSISESLWEYMEDLIVGRGNDVLEKATIIKDGTILDPKIIRFQGR